MLKSKPGSRKGYQFLHIPGRLALGLIGKADGFWHSLRLSRRRRSLRFAREFTLSLPRRSGLESAITDTDERVYSSILLATAEHNRNNVTRTAAYWDVYRSNPELQWAFLAHMVSRNGGWNMTDLKGQWLPHLIDASFASSVYRMLEACNSLIFGDAYPQLRLYIEGNRLGRDLSHLLTRFGVSSFMVPFWERFRLEKDPIPLSIALIVNEQHFIQSRVVEDPGYKVSIFESFTFRSQGLLQLNQILFPLNRKNGGMDTPMRLAGRVLEKFTDLRERIEFGKSLYGLLFGYPNVHRAVTAFAEQTPHTGSRADYWPQRFYNTQKNGRDSGFPNVAAGRSFSPAWTSPRLEDAWPDQELKRPHDCDWYARHSDALKYVKPPKLPRIIDITHEHLFAQHKLQAAVLLERSFMNGANSLRTGRG